jgi:hypothetical protein
MRLGAQRPGQETGTQEQSIAEGIMRVRMDWDWVKGYPIFVYTTFLDNKKFHVKLVKGEYGDQNAGYVGPRAPAWHQYIQTGLASKNEVVSLALKIASRIIKKERVDKCNSVNLKESPKQSSSVAETH